MKDRESKNPFASGPSVSGMSPEEAQIAEALLSIGGVAEPAMVCRTQRLVRERAAEITERRRRARNGIGIAILGFSLLLLVLTPVIWSGFHLQLDEGWSAFTAVDLQSMYVIAWLFPVTMIGLILACARARGLRGTRRLDHRIGSRLGSLVR